MLTVEEARLKTKLWLIGQNGYNFEGSDLVMSGLSRSEFFDLNATTGWGAFMVFSWIVKPRLAGRVV